MNKTLEAQIGDLACTKLPRLALLPSPRAPAPGSGSLEPWGRTAGLHRVHSNHKYRSWRIRLDGRVPSVHEIVAPSYEGRVVGQQKTDYPCDFIGPSQATQGMAGYQLTAEIIR